MTSLDNTEICIRLAVGSPPTERATLDSPRTELRTPAHHDARSGCVAANLDRLRLAVGLQRSVARPSDPNRSGRAVELERAPRVDSRRHAAARSMGSDP